MPVSIVVSAATAQGPAPTVEPPLGPTMCNSPPCPHKSLALSETASGIPYSSCFRIGR
jgi:hypothetical protein